MQRIYLVLGLLVTLGNAACAGTITGTIRAEGKTEAEKDLAGGSYASRRNKFVERVNYSELRDFVIYLDQTMTNSPPPPSKMVGPSSQQVLTPLHR